MMSRFGQCLLYMVICVAVLESAKPKYSLDKKDWVDPGDMLRYDAATKTMKPRVKLSARPVEADPIVVEKFSKEEEPSAVFTQNKHIPSSANCNFHNLFQVRDAMSCAPPRKCECPLCPKSTTDSRKDQLSCDKCDMKFVKRFVQRLIHHFLYEKSEMADELTFDVKMSLSKHELVILETFTTTDSNGAIHEVDDILSRLIHGVKLRQDRDVDFEEARPPVISHFLNNNVVIILIVGGIILVIIIWTRLSTVKGYLMLSILIAFLVSCGYEWIHLYQKLEAAKFAERSQFQNVPIECDPSQISFFNKVWNSIEGSDRCVAYYQSMMVDSFYEINPMMAAISMIGKLGETLSKSVGVSLGTLYKNVLSQFVWYSPFRYAMSIVLTLIIGVVIAAFMYYAIMRSRQPHIQYINAPRQRSSNNMHHRDAIHDLGANQTPLHQQLDHGSMPCQHLPSGSTCPSRSTSTVQRRVEPCREHHRVPPTQSPSSSNYYCIRRQPAIVPSDSVVSSPSRDEVYYVSGEVLHGECECRLAGEAGVHIMADSTNHLIGADSDVGGSATTSQQTEQAEKIARIVSRLADELEKTIISRPEGGSAIAEKNEATGSTCGKESGHNMCSNKLSDSPTRHLASGDAGSIGPTSEIWSSDKSTADVESL